MVILEEKINTTDSTILAKPVNSDSEMAKKEQAIDDTVSTTEDLSVKAAPRVNYIRNSSEQEPIFDSGYTSTMGMDVEYAVPNSKSVKYNPDDEEEYKKAAASETESEMLTNQEAEEIVENYGYAILAGTFASETGSADMRKLFYFYKFNPVEAMLYQKTHIHTDDYSITL